MILLLGAVVVVFLVFLTPIAATHLFPARLASSDGNGRPPATKDVAPRENAEANPPVAASLASRVPDEKRQADTPLRVPKREPATAPPPTMITAPSGKLAVGIGKIVPTAAAELPAVPAAELSPPVPTAPDAAGSSGPMPDIGTIPTPREALPLQTELLPLETPQAEASPKLKSAPPGGNARSNSAAAQRRG